VAEEVRLTLALSLNLVPTSSLAFGTLG